ncbi:3-deoxy-manno-octulosonate cytidylyltransferase [Methyloligella solikamskensis]|uniref:3-deoxy-manno-octulosonate cytidylyltransferase n=1 Tax=Methyloligella solikamskensis TaxID=1177756 RepID=A0ABW3JCD9_9HYPH
MCKTLIIIPARLQASRLPRKPLAPIAGEPMIVHVWRRAVESECGEVVVATDSEEISEAISGAGGRAVLTDPDHQSGSDRVFEALSAADPDKECEIVVNLQGDLPTLDPELVAACVDALKPGEADIATLACEITDEEERTNPHVVKAVGTPAGENLLRALYFTRATAPYGDGPLYHHIGIYAYRRAALERFVSLPPSTLEKREKLEQLRALEANMRINVALVDTVPLGVDTLADLAKARGIMENSGTS